MEEGLNSFFKNSIQKRQFVRVILEKGRGINKKEKKRITALMKACITSKKLEVKIIEVPENSSGVLLKLGKCSH